MNRRTFLQAVAATAAFGATRPNISLAADAKPALLGGKPVHKGGWVSWPQWRPEWESKMLEVYRSCKWFRLSGPHVPEFEKAWAEMLGAKKALACASGTTSLIISLNVMDVDAGDEVIVSPYTFIASYNAILNRKALPVFSDTNPETLTMCPKSIESRITERTKAIMPVHIYGMPCDMDAINPIAKKHKLAVVEDACQAWLAEYKGRKCGTLGDIGGFSFQESKHIPSGEGGAITSMSEELIDKCNSYHNCGRACGTNKGNGSFTRGDNYRMTQFQAALLLQQFDKLKKETFIRQGNADHLRANLGKIPGIKPVRLPENSKPSWHLCAFLYDTAQFNGLSRDKFMNALRAEGVGCSSPYREQYYDGLLDEAINSRGYKRLWSDARLKAYRESFKELKGNKQACETMFAFGQSMLLADRKDLDQIGEGIWKIHKFSAELAKKA